MKEKVENNYSIEDAMDLVENMELMAQQVLPDGTIAFVNSSWKQQLGYSDEELHDMNIFDVIAPESREFCETAFRALMENGSAGAAEEMKELETVFVAKSGEKIYVRGYVNCRREEGKPVILRGVFRNVTKDRLIEESLFRCESRHEEILESLPIGVFRTTPGHGGRIIYANRKNMQIHGYSSMEEFMARPVASYYADPDDRKAVAAELLERGRIIDREIRCRRRNGEIFWGRINVFVRKDENGEEFFEGTIEDVSEKKAFQMKTLENERKYRELFENSPLAILTLDEELIITDCNKETEELFGYEVKELRGSHILEQDILLSGGAKKVFGAMSKAASGAKAKTFNVDVFRKDGASRLIECVASADKSDEGNYAYQLICRDITRREQAEKGRRASEERYRALFENAMEGIGVLDTYSRSMVAANRAMCELLGYSPEEIIGLSVFDMHPADTMEERGREIASVIESGSAKIENVPLVRKDGCIVYADISASLILMDERVCVVGFFSDVTSKINAEKEIKILAGALEQVANVVVVTDTDGNIEMVNDAFEKVTGYEWNKVIGQNPRVMKSGIHEERFYREMWEKLNAGETWQGRICNKKANGELFWEEAVISPLKDDNGKIIKYIAIKQDITERLELEDQREKLLKEITNKNKELEDFTYAVSHDLKAPLVTIEGFVEIIKEDYGASLDEEALSFLGRISDSSEKMKTLIADLLNFGRAGMKIGNVETFTLKKAVTDMKSMFEFVEPQKSVVIEMSSEDIEITAVEKDMSLILENLVGNAIKYIGDVEGPLVQIGWEELAGERVFYVRDNGIGIEPESQRKIFEMFHRAPKTAHIQGTGIGLATVKKIVEKYGGRIWLESEPGKGSRFLFTLPEPVATSK